MKNNILAPIILFVYNRPWHTKQTLEALMLNDYADQSTLYIYCDGPKFDASQENLKSIEEVRTVIREKKWCKEVIIIERECNLGLAANIIAGVTEIVNKHGKIIVLEDDIKIEKGFLKYMNQSLNFFENNKIVFHINGFNNETNLQFLLRKSYFLKFMSCWGWATWKDRWDKIILDHNHFYELLMDSSETLSDYNYDNILNFHKQLEMNINNEIKTWAILWFSTVYFNKGLCLTPKFSFVNNIGMDGTGVHCGANSNYNKSYSKNNVIPKNYLKRINIKELRLSRLHLKLFYKYGSEINFTKIFKSKVKGILKRFV